MNNKRDRMRQLIAALATAVLGAGCGYEGPQGPAAITPDGVVKGTAEQPELMNPTNDPGRFAISMNRKIQDLPRSGEALRKPFPANWWPFQQDGIARRWMGSSVPSPAEKYDFLTAPDQIRAVPLTMAGNPTDSGGTTQEFNLGPAGTWEMQEHGRYGDLYPDSWWGHCNGWSSYTLNEEEPKRPAIVRMEGGEVVQCESATEPGCVRFEVGDVNALMTELYFIDAFRMAGGRCFTTAANFNIDQNGRIRADECRDSNAGALHIIAANMLGIQQRMFIVDITADAQVWNYPAYKYEVMQLEEVSVTEALRAIGTSGSNYPFNPDAKRFFKVATKFWIVEDAIPPRATPSGAELETYTSREIYNYILETAADGTILGGEWTGNSKVTHPDFIWYSYDHSANPTDDDLNDGDNPAVRYSIVKKIHSLSAAGSIGLPPGAKEYSASPILAIPDNDPNGVSHTINVPDTYAVAAVQVAVEIPHTYIGDLVISLMHTGVRATLHYREGGNADNLIRTFEVGGMNGMAANGEWTLSVSDHSGADVGALARWRLILVPSSSGGTTGIGAAHNYSAAPNLTIPDNNAAGIQDTLSVPDAFTVGGVRVGVEIDHPYISDLVVALVHGTVAATLHYRGGRSADNLSRTFDTSLFNGLPASGDWSLVVSDNSGADVGTLRSWQLTLYEGSGSASRVFAQSPNTTIPDNEPAGLSSTIAVTEPLTIGTLRVAVDIEHTYIGDLVVTVTGNGVTAVLHNRGGGDTHDIVRTFDLPQFAGQSATGSWVLKVADMAAVDVGALRSWRLIVGP